MMDQDSIRRYQLLDLFQQRYEPVWIVDEYLRPTLSHPIDHKLRQLLLLYVQQQLDIVWEIEQFMDFIHMNEIIPRLYLGSCDAVYTAHWTHVVSLREPGALPR